MPIAATTHLRNAARVQTHEIQRHQHRRLPPSSLGPFAKAQNNCERVERERRMQKNTILAFRDWCLSTEHNLVTTATTSGGSPRLVSVYSRNGSPKWPATKATTSGDNHVDPDRVARPQEVQQHVPEVLIHGLVGTPTRPGVLVPLGPFVPGRAALVEHRDVVEARPQDALAVI